MIADTFDPSADAIANYNEAWRAIRLMTLLTADRWPQPWDEFDLLLAADLMRGRG